MHFLSFSNTEMSENVNYKYTYFRESLHCYNWTQIYGRSLDSQMTPHSSPSRVSYAVSFMSILWKVCYVMISLNCMESNLCLTGDICPVGAWCAVNSSSPVLCQGGYYLNSTGNDDITDCIQCTPGQYCAGSGNEVPDGDCAEGWYCPGGQDDPRPTGYNCTLGKQQRN